jgi:hypothetical protein
VGAALMGSDSLSFITKVTIAAAAAAIATTAPTTVKIRRCLSFCALLSNCRSRLSFAVSRRSSLLGTAVILHMRLGQSTN